MEIDLPMGGSRDLFDLSGKVALITGAAGLLGPFHAVALAAKGAHVILGDCSAEALEKTRTRFKNTAFFSNFEFVYLDVTNLDSIRSIVSANFSRGNGIDILINNAALNPKMTSGELSGKNIFETFSIEQWNAEIDVGLTGAFLVSREVGAMMVRNLGGVILNIASDLSVIAPDQRIYNREEAVRFSKQVKPVSYSAVKHGLVGLTKYIATYWGDRGVRCNCLSPGGVYDGQDESLVASLIKRIPMARMAEKSEYIGAIQFLCSDAARYMNGQNVVIDGGRSIW